MKVNLLTACPKILVRDFFFHHSHQDFDMEACKFHHLFFIRISTAIFQISQPSLKRFSKQSVSWLEKSQAQNLPRYKNTLIKAKRFLVIFFSSIFQVCHFSAVAGILAFYTHFLSLCLLVKSYTYQDRAHYLTLMKIFPFWNYVSSRQSITRVKLNNAYENNN